MCGIVGVLGKDLRYNDFKLFTDLLEADQIRGRHSTGVVAVADDQVYVHKKALSGSDFVQLAKAREVIQRADSVLIGHNRFATKGSINDASAHPFVEDTVHMVHNGTITNQWELVPGSHAEVDSRVIAMALAEAEPTSEGVSEVLEVLQGAYCIVWFDTRDNKLKFARNDERPLGLHTTEDNRLVWSSDGKLAEALLSHNNIDIKASHELIVGRLTSIDIDTLAPEYHDFTPRPPAPTYNTMYGSRGNSRTQPAPPAKKEVPPVKKLEQFSSSSTGTGCTDTTLRTQFPIGSRTMFYATSVYEADNDGEVECWCVDSATSTTDIIAVLPEGVGVQGGLYEGRVAGYTEMWTDYWVVDVVDVQEFKKAGTAIECAWCSTDIPPGGDVEIIGEELLHAECFETYQESIEV